jgi:hypothetical protein
MRKQILAYVSVIAYLACHSSAATAQAEQPYHQPSEPQLPAQYQWTMLPTDRSLRMEGAIDEPHFPGSYPLTPAAEGNNGLVVDSAKRSPPDLKSLLKPRIGIKAEWEPEVDGVAIASYDLSFRMPTYPVFGPPPPFVIAGYSFTNIDASPALDLPDSLHDLSIGLAWVRPINDRWAARLMINTAFASDLENTSGDALQIRAGGFAVYRPNERWSLALGAMATGRDDIPVIPAAGAIWEPSPEFRVDLMLPNPKISLLLADTGERQHWGYVGGGFSGGTWAYERASGVGDRLTYREWRLVLGWESMPPRLPGTFVTSGTRFNAEVGYVFGRRFEFDSNMPAISPDGTLLLRTGMNF